MADIVSNAIRTHVQILGQGPREAVLIHGIVVDNLASMYFALGNPLALLARVILYDLRGHGKTERTADGYDLDNLLADLDGVIAATATSPSVYLVGHSYGGLLALSYAAQKPERVSGLVLLDPPLPLSGYGPSIAAIFCVQGEERDRRIREAYDGLHGNGETRKRRRLSATAESLVSDTSLLEDLRRSRALDEADLARIRCPVLAFYGEGSEILTCREQLRALIPQAEILTIPGCSHRVLLEATEKVREITLEWMARQR